MYQTETARSVYSTIATLETILRQHRSLVVLAYAYVVCVQKMFYNASQGKTRVSAWPIYNGVQLLDPGITEPLDRHSVFAKASTEQAMATPMTSPPLERARARSSSTDEANIGLMRAKRTLVRKASSYSFLARAARSINADSNAKTSLMRSKRTTTCKAARRFLARIVSSNTDEEKMALMRSKRTTTDSTNVRVDDDDVPSSPTNSEERGYVYKGKVYRQPPYVRFGIPVVAWLLTLCVAYSVATVPQVTQRSCAETQLAHQSNVLVKPPTLLKALLPRRALQKCRARDTE
jgi:hypothetical protein